MRSALLLALVGCAFTVQARNIDVATTARLAFPHWAAEAKQFGEFAAEYKREYASKEEVLERFSVFVNNLEKIKRANEEAKGLATYGITPFADWSWEEFRQKMLLHGKPEFNRTALPQYKPKDLQTKHPDNWDWRVSNIVTGIKNQGGCGSCWAFATTAVVESMNAKAGRGLIDLAEQQMVDCIEDGCGGGTLQHSFGYAQDHGLPSEGDYPYQGQRGICHDAKIAAKLNQMYVLPQDEEAIANSITDGGPSAVGFEVGDTFMHYKGGIVTSHDCDGTNSWHANAAVGYGVDGGNHFWILKNSWGTGWGEGGYSRVQRGSNWCQVNCMAAAGGIW